MADLTIELAFGSTWLDDPAGFTWVDESSYGEKATCTRGRSSELELFPAGTAAITLDSAQRRFDPLNADGPYYGQLLPGVPVRVTADGEPLFYGYVDGWDHAVGTFQGTVTVQATDAFKYLAGVPLAGVYEPTVIADGPLGYWPLGGTDGDVATDLSGNRRHGVYTGDVERGVAPGRLFGGAAGFAGGLVQLDAGLTTATIYECWIRFPEPPTVRTRVFSVWGVSPRLLTINATGVIATHVNQTAAATNVIDGRWHHIVAGLAGIYLDGEAVPSEAIIGPTEQFGPNPQIGGTTYDASDPVELSDVAVYATGPSVATLATTHYAAGRAPWNGETTGARVERILDAAGWPAALRAIDPGEVACGNADTAGVTALEYLQVLAQTEGGRAFIARDGKVTFHDAARLDPFPIAPTVIFDTELEEGSISFSIDETFTFDGAEVQKKYGVAQYAGAAFPTRVYSATGLAMRDDTAALARAERIVARYSTPRTRAKSWAVQQPADLDVELGDVVRLTLTPQLVGDPITLDLFVEQITHAFDPADNAMALYGSPIDTRNLFRFDGPNTVGAVNGFEAGVMR